MGKHTWKAIKIPNQLFENIKDVIPWLGVPSVAEYVRQTVRECLKVCSVWNKAYSLFQRPYDFLAAKVKTKIIEAASLERLRRDSLYVDNIKERMKEEKDLE